MHTQKLNPGKRTTGPLKDNKASAKKMTARQDTNKRPVRSWGLAKRLDRKGRNAK